MRRFFPGWLFGMIGLLLMGTAAAAPIEMGEPFPKVPLPAPLEVEQRSYLGLTDDQPFTLDQVKGRVVLVEMLNVLCPHCQKQTAPYNELFDRLNRDPVTRGQVKMLGVAVANTDEQIDDFVVIYNVRYPVVPDRRFSLHQAVRGGPTPFSIYVLRDAPGETGVVAGTHLGEDPDMATLFDYLKYLLNSTTAEFAALAPEQTLTRTVLEPPQTEGELTQQIKIAFASQGKDLQDFRRLELLSGRRVYTASIDRDGHRESVFAEVTSRSAICDICHNVHFFYVFDRKGIVLAFEPLHLTKYGNVEWNDAEVAYFTRRVLDRPLVGTWNFDPDVDAVTSATMTSAIIFNSLDQGRELLDELRAQGLL
jgi:hypothetical protein